MLGDNGMLEYNVNANTGAILKIEDEHIRGKLMSFINGITKQDLKNEKTGLAEAVGMA